MAVGWYPWLDYRGRLSPLKLAVFTALFAPGMWIALAWGFGGLGARPLLEAERQLGLWTIRLLFVTLAITPLRQILRWPRLAILRRMVGVAVFAFVAVHFFLYIADQAFDLGKVAVEIALRIYLTIGFVGVLTAAALASTSTDGAVRRLGSRRWRHLHRLIYLISVLAVLHFFMQSKLDEWEPTIMAGLFAWLMGYRLLIWATGRPSGLSVWLLGFLSLAAIVPTAFGEALYYWIGKGVDPLRVLQANFSLAAGLRPACVVTLFGLAVTLAGVLRRLFITRSSVTQDAG